MTKKQVLTKVFEKAAEGGYKINTIVPMDKIIEYGIYYKFIFNHDFAKAFFKQRFTGGRLIVRTDYFLDKLAEMSREEEPIKYLEKFLKKGG